MGNDEQKAVELLKKSKYSQKPVIEQFGECTKPNRARNRVGFKFEL
jgi:hypothetical protein